MQISLRAAERFAQAYLARVTLARYLHRQMRNKRAFGLMGLWSFDLKDAKSSETGLFRSISPQPRAPIIPKHSALCRPTDNCTRKEKIPTGGGGKQLQVRRAPDITRILHWHPHQPCCRRLCSSSAIAGELLSQMSPYMLVMNAAIGRHARLSPSWTPCYGTQE